ncbi:MAG: hypothetical protein IPH18_05255 [Chitinophagaceae bacterium]|nr:hypothetical protein [Chitinophagaceae bacterium]
MSLWPLYPMPEDILFGQRPGITTLYLLQYKTGNDLSIQVADSIRWPAVSELAGGLRQLPGEQ